MVKDRVPLALVAQELAKQLREHEQAEGKPCAYRADMLRGVHDWGLLTVLAGDQMGGAAALVAAGEAQHTTPVKPATAPLTDKARWHILFGDVDPKTDKARGWHHRPSGDSQKGTRVIEGTESPKDKHGVYEANVQIGGIPKKARSSFFPDDWSQEKVEQAIHEAYGDRQATDFAGVFRGYSADGVLIELWLDAKGQITTAFPLYGKGK